MTVLEQPLLNFIVWALAGLIISLIVGIVDSGKVKGGLFLSSLLGIIGGLLGGIIASGFFNITDTASLLRSFLFAVLGGLVLTLLHRLFFRITGHIKTTTKENG